LQLDAVLPGRRVRIKERNSPGFGFLFDTKPELMSDYNVLLTILLHRWRPMIPRTFEVPLVFPNPMTPSLKGMVPDQIFRECSFSSSGMVHFLDVRPHEPRQDKGVPNEALGFPGRVDLLD